MKTKPIFSILMLFCGMTTFAQHPLVGTWEMVSVKGTAIDGKPADWTTANMRETKIITPTHYMLIQHIVRNDSVLFNTAHAGTVRFEGNKYIETTTVTSAPTPNTAKKDYTWKVKGDLFIQSGTITWPDGRKIIIDELVFKKVKGAPANPKNPIFGTWNQLSSDYTAYDGTKGLDTPSTATKFWLLTPTHWAQIGHRNNKFVFAQCGSYIIENDKIKPTVTVASFKLINKTKYDITYRLDGNKLQLTGTATREDGNKMSWLDVLEKVVGQ